MRGPLLVLAVLLLGAAGAGCLRDFDEPHEVRVTNLDLAAHRVLASEVELNLTTSLDNAGGGASDPLRLLAKAYDEATGFLVTQESETVPPIPGDTTRLVDQRLTVPREGSYRIEVQLFEDDQVVQEASIVARNLGLLKPEVYETGLQITEMDFTVEDVTEGRGNATRARIAASLYVTNEADAPSEDLRVQVKAREVSTGLVADTQWLQTGAIRPGTTVIRTVNLSVPDGYNYLVEVLTWRSDTIVDRAEGRVQLAPTFEVPDEQEIVVTNPDIREFRKPPADASGAFAGEGNFAEDAHPEPAAVPAPALALVAAALAAAALALHRRGRP